MTTTNASPQRRIPRPAGMRAEVHRRVLERLGARDTAVRRRAAAARRQVDGIQRDHQAKLERLFGPEGYERWRGYARSRRAGAPTPVLRELGVKPEALQALTDAWQDKLREVAAGLSIADRVDPVREVPPVAAPVVTRPPFPAMHVDELIDAYSYGGRHGQREVDPRFTAEARHTVDVGSGRTEATLRTINRDAGDWDYVFATSEASVGFFHRTTRSGRLRLVVDVRAANVTHGVTFGNEWGYSAGFVIHDSGVQFTCAGPDDDFGAAAQLSSFVRQYEEPGKSFSQPLLPFTARRVTMTTAGSFPADTDVWVEVGSYSTQFDSADDLTVDSVVTGEWVVDSVTVGPA